MAFPTGWGRKCELVIQSSQVASALTDFPVLLTLATLPSEMFDADGSNPAQNGGGDIRFSSDSAGSSQLACEIVTFTTDNTPANGVAEIWVKVPSISASVNTSIYVWYNTAGTDLQPAVTDTYGRNAVWANYAAVWHLNSTGSQTDATGNGHTLTEAGNPISGASPWGATAGAITLDGNVDSYSAATNPRGNSSFTAQMWFTWDTSGAAEFLIDDGSGTDGGFQIFCTTANKVRIRVDDSGANGGVSDTSTSVNDSTYRLLHAVVDKSSTAQIYLNGSADGTGLTISTYGDISPTANVLVGTQAAPAGSNPELDGNIDEARIRESVLASGWLSSEYNNQSSPGTFVIEGTPETPAAGGATPKGPFGLMFHGPMGGPV